MDSADKHLEKLSIYDKIIRLQNLKVNLEESKPKNFIVSHINSDYRLLKLIKSIMANYQELNSANLIFFLNALAYYQINDKEF